MPVVTPQQSDGPTDAHGGDALDGIGPVETPTADVDPAPPPRRRRTRRVLVAVVALLLAGGVGVAVAVVSGDGDPDEGGGTSDAEAAPIRAVEAEQRDLAEVEEVDGTLSYGDPTPVGSAVSGTVTALPEAGDELTRGDAAYEVDTVPVTVMWGDTPLYRTLEEGVDAGRDVELLEENLVALGYDAGGELEVDETFDERTRAAVEEWETDAGAVVDGAVEPAQVVVLAGPAIVESVDATIGSSASPEASVLSVRITDDVTTAQARRRGRITRVASEDDRLVTGDVLYELDTVGVPVVVGDEPLDRTLSTDSSDGDDVRQLERALRQLGYDADGDLDVDRDFDESTREAVEDWERDLGLDRIDGIVQLEQYVVVPADARVTNVSVERGDRVDGGTALVEVGVSTRQVVAEIASEDEDLIAEGDAVDVELPDGTTVRGSITDVDVGGSSSAGDETDADGEATTSFTVALDETPDAVADRDEIDVSVQITTELARDATVVPSNALVSRGDGSYAVEVVDGGAVQTQPVEPGLFADGYVAVEGIEPGTPVVVPE